MDNVEKWERTVHSVSKSGDEGQISDGEKGKVLVSVDGLVARLNDEEVIGTTIRIKIDINPDAQLEMKRKKLGVGRMGANLLMMNRRVAQTSIQSIDVADELGNLPLELDGFGKSGLGDLDEDDLSTPFGVAFEELFEGLQLRVCEQIKEVERSRERKEW